MKKLTCDGLANVGQSIVDIGRGGGGGAGIDLYKFLSWFMSVIFLYYLV